jgi:hypothetical protein
MAILVFLLFDGFGHQFLRSVGKMFGQQSTVNG